MFLNPGSHISKGTKEQAHLNAKKWLERMKETGIHNVTIDDDPAESEGRWYFTLKHTLTGVTAELGIHGLSLEEIEEYQNSNIFKAMPRIYWNGGSSSTPSHKDFLREGFRVGIVAT